MPPPTKNTIPTWDETTELPPLPKKDIPTWDETAELPSLPQKVSAASPMEEAPEGSYVDESINDAKAALYGGVQGATFGVGNEAASGLVGLAGAVASKLDPRQDITREEILATLSPETRAKATKVFRPKAEDFSSLLEEYYKTGKKEQSDVMAASPGTTLAANLAGGLATMKIPGLSQLSITKSTSPYLKFAERAAKGALVGGVSGLTGEGGTLEERRKDAGVGAVIGGGLTAGIPIVGAGIMGAKRIISDIGRTQYLKQFPEVFKAGLKGISLVSKEDAEKYGNIVYAKAKAMGVDVGEYTKQVLKNISDTIEAETAKGTKIDVKSLIDDQLRNIDNTIIEKMPIAEGKAALISLKGTLGELRSEIKDRSLPKEQIEKLQTEIKSITEQIAERTKEHASMVKTEKLLKKVEAFKNKELMSQTNDKIKTLELQKRDLNNLLRKYTGDDDVREQIKREIISLEDSIISEKRLQLGNASGINKSNIAAGRNETLDQGLNIHDVDSLTAQKAKLESNLGELQAYNPEQELMTPSQLYDKEKAFRNLGEMDKQKSFPAKTEKINIVNSIKKLLSDTFGDKLQKEQTNLHQIKKFGEALGLENFDPEDVNQINRLYSILKAPEGVASSIPKQKIMESAFSSLSSTPGGKNIVNKYAPEILENARYSEIARDISSGSLFSKFGSSPLMAANIIGKHTPEGIRKIARAISRGSNKASAFVSEQLEKIAMEPNREKRNAILFGLMQNPVYREMVGQNTPRGSEDESEQ